MDGGDEQGIGLIGPMPAGLGFPLTDSPPLGGAPGPPRGSRGSCADNYVLTRTWIATDNCGNSSDCKQTITVTNTTGPEIKCPFDMTLTCEN